MVSYNHSRLRLHEVAEIWGKGDDLRLGCEGQRFGGEANVEAERLSRELGLALGGMSQTWAFGTRVLTYMYLLGNPAGAVALGLGHRASNDKIQKPKINEFKLRIELATFSPCIPSSSKLPSRPSPLPLLCF